MPYILRQINIHYRENYLFRTGVSILIVISRVTGIKLKIVPNVI